MLFKESQARFLCDYMCFDVQEFEQHLLNEFVDEAYFFNKVVEFLIQDKASKYFKNIDIMNFPVVRDSFLSRFSDFLETYEYRDGIVFDYCYELFNYFCSFYFGGLSSLFKDRSPEWFGPRIYLKKCISNKEQLVNLPDVMTVYRGMSLDEFNSNSFGMSWSLDIGIARNFARIQSDLNVKSVVVSSTIDKVNILYHDPNDSEKEIVITNGLISSGVFME